MHGLSGGGRTIPKKARIDLAKILGQTPDAQQARVRRVALVVAAEWKRQAAAKLGSTLSAYQRGIVVGEPQGNKVSVELHGTIPNMVEQGMGPGGIGTQGSYDARKFVLKPGTSNLRRTASGHMYVNVPFGHNEASIVSLGGQPALNAAKALKPSRTVPGGDHTVWGGRLPSGYHRRLTGLVRLQKQYSRARGAAQSTYRTWRTMSQIGRAWMTSGVRARHIAMIVVNRLPQILREVL